MVRETGEDGKGKGRGREGKWQRAASETGRDGKRNRKGR